MKRGLVLACVLVAGCIPRVDRPEPPPRPAPGRPPVVRPAEPSAATLQCHADMRREEFRFRPLPDQYFSGGCSALGAVQLIDIGTPTTNLGAMTCPLALRFGRWVREAVQPAAGQWLRSRVVKVESMGTYACRPVNNMAGNRISEHGLANAVDIGGFVLEDGRRITVLAGWNGGDEDVRGFLRAVHQAGCRRFGITLGPDANALHRDHFHFDMGRGPYCR